MMMRDAAPKTIHRQDYQEPDFHISHVDLAFEISDGKTRVTSSLRIDRRGQHNRPLVLDGEQLELEAITIDGNDLWIGWHLTRLSSMVVASN